MEMPKVFVRCVLGLVTTGGAMAQEPGAAKFCTVELVRGALAEDHAQLLTNDLAVAVDAAGAAAEKLLQTKFTKKPKLVVYADTRAFRAAEKAGSKLSFLVDEVCDADGTTGHVRLLPLLGNQVGMQVGLPESTRQTVTRVAAQLLVQQHFETMAADPWLAGVVAFGVMESIVNPTGVFGVDPHFDARRATCWKWIGEGNSLELQPILQRTNPFDDAQRFETRRDEQAILAQVLAKDEVGWARKLVSKAPKGTTQVTNRFRVIESVLGKEWPKNEARWAAAMRALAPKWRAKGHVRTMANGFEIAGSGTEASAVNSLALLPAADYAIRCRVTIDGAGRPGVRVELAWDASGILAVLLQPGRCVIKPWTGGWGKELASAEAGIQPGVPFDLSIEVSDQVRAFVDGKEVAAVPCDRRFARGNFDVVTNDSLVIVENLRIEPLQPAKK